jgi:hypothetical protein
MEKTYSASPYAFVPKRFMTTTMSRKIVTKMALLILTSQYDVVRAAAMISSGRVTSHCMA